MSKKDTLIDIIIWPLVFLVAAGILFLIGLDIYFIVESIFNLGASIEIFVVSMAITALLSATLLMILYVLGEAD